MTAWPVAQPVISSAAILHPAAETLDQLDACLRAGQSAAAIFDGFAVSDWAKRNLADAEQARHVVSVAGRAPLPTRTAACVALTAVRAAALGEAAREAVTILIAGNNLALRYQASANAAFQAYPRRVRAAHLLDGLDTDSVGAVAEVIGCRGEGWTTGAASASGAAALIQAARLVGAGLMRHCLVVAPVTDISELELAAFRHSGAMAPAPGPVETALGCAPFDIARTGFCYGQAAAAIMVENLDTARSRGVPVLAKISGVGQRLDGRRTTRPDLDGQVAAMRAALDMANVDAADIDYVSAHGTGSVVGDATEADALAKVFAGSRPAINATKAILGHGLCAAGLVEVVATTLQMAGNYCHANPYLRDPVLPELNFVGPATVSRTIHHAMSNSFAFSGINTSIVLTTLQQ